MLSLARMLRARGAAHEAELWLARAETVQDEREHQH
jgi:hypothetical protein